jgi:hypothetical protein
VAPTALDVFLTASQEGVVQMWDLRACAPVRSFAGHVSRSQPVGAALSPCLRYIASGSEDRVRGAPAP